MLAQQLREMELDGLLFRAREAGNRARAYSLTPIGYRLGDVLDALAEWGAHYRGELPAAIDRHGLAQLADAREMRTKSIAPHRAD
jgi:DNA-binding HxlR family transcriptional regulator